MMYNKNMPLKSKILEERYFSYKPDKPGPLVLTRLSHELFQPGCHIRRTQRPNCVILFVLDGSALYRSRKGSVELGKGVVFSFLPDMHHEVLCRPGETLEVRRVVFVGTESVALHKQYLGDSCHAWKLSTTDEVSEILMHMYRLARTSPSFAHESCTLYLRILLQAIHRGIEKSAGRRSAGMATFLDSKAIIDKQFSSAISVADVARKVGITYEHLSRQFVKYGGDSPGVYIKRLRMNKAAELLSVSGYKVEAAAEEIGYADIYTFSKAFKQFFGISPSHYARKWSR
jgi:AraC-like DNA-binding protein